MVHVAGRFVSNALAAYNPVAALRSHPQPAYPVGDNQMAVISESYLQELAPIYKDVLAGFVRFNPARRPGEGLAFQSLYSVLDDRYTLGEIRAACLEMEKNREQNSSSSFRGWIAPTSRPDAPPLRRSAKRC